MRRGTGGSRDDADNKCERKTRTTVGKGMIDVADVEITARDGVRLSGFAAGGGVGPALVLCNSLLGGVDGWTELIEDFAPYHHLVGWQYRGMRGRDAQAATIEQHTEDLLDVLDHHKIDKCVLVGWSMGSRVAFEAMNVAPDRFIGGVIVCGVLGRPLQRLAEPFAGPLAAIAPRLGDLAAELAPYAPSVWQLAGMGARSGTVHDILRLIGAVSESVARPRLGELLAETTSLSLEQLLGLLRAIDHHVVHKPLQVATVPTLIIGGSADPLCPRGDVMRAAEGLGTAETMIVPSAGHLLPVEFAELLHLRIAKFLRVHTGFDRLAGTEPPALTLLPARI